MGICNSSNETREEKPKAKQSIKVNQLSQEDKAIIECKQCRDKIKAYIKNGEKMVQKKKEKAKELLRNKDKVVVEGVNIVKRHQKPTATNQTGGIIERENPIHISNIMMADPKTGKSTRIGHEINKDGKKVRISKKSNEKID